MDKKSWLSVSAKGQLLIECLDFCYSIMMKLVQIDGANFVQSE